LRPSSPGLRPPAVLQKGTGVVNARIFGTIALFVAFVATVVLANELTTEHGLVTAGFGLTVTAGTYAAGLALGLRDALHELGGVWLVLLAILTGALTSWWVADGRIAVASGVAFGLAELLDLTVYSALRDKGWHVAVIVSNAVGALADTLLFLWIADFPITDEAVGGQMLVKAVWVTAGFLIVAEVIRRCVTSATPAHPRSVRP
jgi:uncharacterized PurR-regulated membrane protein YhhQ (DUF165 family)